MLSSTLYIMSLIVTYSGTKFEVATSNCLGVEHDRRTHFGMKFIYHIFLKIKVGIISAH